MSKNRNKNMVLKLEDYSLVRRALGHQHKEFTRIISRANYEVISKDDLSRLEIYCGKMDGLVKGCIPKREVPEICVDNETGEKYQYGLNQETGELEYVVRLKSLKHYRKAIERLRSSKPPEHALRLSDSSSDTYSPDCSTVS